MATIKRLRRSVCLITSPSLLKVSVTGIRNSLALPQSFLESHSLLQKRRLLGRTAPTKASGFVGHLRICLAVGGGFAYPGKQLTTTSGN